MWTFLALAVTPAILAGTGLSQTAGGVPATAPARGEIIVVPEEPEEAPPATVSPGRPERPPMAEGLAPGQGGADEDAPALGAPAGPGDANAIRPQGPGPAVREDALPVPGRSAPAGASAVDEEPAVPITRAGNARAEPALNPLPHEGKQTVRRRARLERNTATGWSMLNFENEEGAEKLPVGWVLPCRLLERMEQMAERDAQTVFEISCDNTIYDGRCFVLLRAVRIAQAPLAPLPEPAALAALSAPPESPASAPAPADTQPATEPATRPAPSPIQRPFVGPSSAEVLQGLLKGRRGTPVIVDDRRATAGVRPLIAGPSRAEPSVALLEHPNKMVTNRRAQLISTGNGAWKEIRFYDDNNLQLPPLTVLPSAMLKKAEANQDSDLAVTGEITVYRNRQFIILHGVEPILPLGRF